VSISKKAQQEKSKAVARSNFAVVNFLFLIKTKRLTIKETSIAKK
jgi:hypothetical protein